MTKCGVHSPVSLNEYTVNNQEAIPTLLRLGKTITGADWRLQCWPQACGVEERGQGS